MFYTPVLFLIFNRPDTTFKVFEVIKHIKPKALFIAADGPRLGKEGEIKKCQQAREVIKQIDWECEVHTLLRENNLGCKKAVSFAIDWFFEHVEEGIILEDDTLPHPDFFAFCANLLQRHRNDLRVMHIGGNNLLPHGIVKQMPYYFSIYNHIWGWATWRRAWRLYDREMTQLERFIEQNQIKAITNSKIEQQYWIESFLKVRRGEIDTWDLQWTFSIWNKGGMAALPSVNLVSNIGFRADATHTTGDSPLANLPTQSLKVTRHPLIKRINRRADICAREIVFQLVDVKPRKNKWWSRLTRLVC